MAFLLKVPFENLDINLHRQIRLSSESIYKKIISKNSKPALTTPTNVSRSGRKGRDASTPSSSLMYFRNFQILMPIAS